MGVGKGYLLYAEQPGILLFTACETDAECSSGKKCDTTTHTCGDCVTDSDCTGGKTCIKNADNVFICGGNAREKQMEQNVQEVVLNKKFSPGLFAQEEFAVLENVRNQPAVMDLKDMMKQM